MVKGHGEKLSRKQEQALAALLTAPTLQAAAEQVGVSERTLRSWLRLPAFATEYRRLRRALLHEAVADLQAVAGEAVRTLRQNLGAARASDSTRAAMAILTLALKGEEALDLAEKLVELEARLQELARVQ